MKTDFKSHPINHLMSRTGSFPFRVANELLKKYGKPNCTVMDMFCGKGTSLFAARSLGYKAYGLDIAPEAVICSHAKMLNVNKSEVIDYIKNLKIQKTSNPEIPDRVKIFFHPETIKQILGFKARLLEDINVGNVEEKQLAVFCLATLLGILHGHASYSLSLSCAHAYSMSPDYVSRYAKENDLTLPLRNVKECLKKKVDICLRELLPNPVEFGIQRGCASKVSSLFPHLLNSVDIILTSPPYLNAQTYAKDNWLRLWLLGYNYKDISGEYLQTSSIEKYMNFMNIVFQEVFKMLKPGGYIICIAGDANIKRVKFGMKYIQKVNTSEILKNLCVNNINGFELQKEKEQLVPSKLRYFHSLNFSNGHSENNIVEKVLVAKKIL